MAIKSEDSSITGNGHSLLRNQAPRIKRERDENSPNMNTVQGAATVKRQRKSDTIETVDLTGDAPVIKTESRGFDRAKGPVVDLSED